jgi:hypothetical protein
MRGKSGFIKTVLIIVVALVVLGFFGYNLRDIVDSPDVRDNLSYLWEIIVKIWNNFIIGPAIWIWDKVSGAKG